MASAAELAILINVKDQASGPLGNVANKVDDVGKKADKAGTQSEGLGKKLGGVATIASGFVVAQALTSLPGLLSSSAEKAVSLEQNAKKAATVFGDELGSVEQWASESARSMGLTNAQAVTLAAGMADLLIPMGMTREQAAKMSTETIGLAGALAEWSGGQKSAAEVSDILTKAFLGETDGLKALGISLNQAEIDARMAALGTADLTKEQIAQQKASVIQALIMEKSTDAQTAFAEGAGTLARQQAEAKAKMAEASEQLSTALLPAITAGTTLFAGLASILAEKVVPAIGPLVEIIIDLAEKYTGPLVAGLAAIGAVLLATVIPSLVATVAAALPLIAIMVAVGAAAALLYAAWDSNFLGIRDITMQVIDFLKPYIMDGISSIVSTVQTGIGIVRAVWDEVFPYIRSVVETVFPIIATIVTTYIAILQKEIELGVAAAKWAFDNVFVPIQGVVSDVFTTIAGIVTTVWGPTVTAIGVGVDTVKTIFDGIVVIQGIISDVFSTIAGLVEDLWNSGAVLSIAAGIGTIKGLFEGIYDTMYAFGSAMVQGLIDGATSLIRAFEGVWDTISGIADKIIAAKNLISSPSRLMYERGRQLMEGLTLGVLSGVPGYASAWDTVAGIGDRRMSGQYGDGGGSVGGGYGGGQYGSRPGQGGGNYGGGGGAVGGGHPGSGGIIGDPASGYVGPDLYNNGGKGSGGGKSMGVAVGANGAPTGGPASGLSPASSGQGSMGGTDAGLAALEAGAVFIGCSWEMVGTSNDNGLFMYPNGEKKWRSTRFCRDGRNGPNASELAQAANAIKKKEEKAAASLAGTVKSTGGGSTTYYGSPQPKTTSDGWTTGSNGVLTYSGPQKSIEKQVEDGYVNGARRIMNGSRQSTRLVGG